MVDPQTLVEMQDRFDEIASGEAGWQNIPVACDIGEEIRIVNVPPPPGWEEDDPTDDPTVTPADSGRMGYRRPVDQWEDLYKRDEAREEYRHDEDPPTFDPGERDLDD